MTDALDTDQLAALYRGCDVFVLPYRGEGFGMPIAEAMACGKPVIVTDAGPAREFCPDDCGYRIHAKVAPAMESHLLKNEFTGNLTWFEPDAEHLAAAMREAFDHPETGRQKGQRGAAWIHARYAWPMVLERMMERIGELID